VFFSAVNACLLRLHLIFLCKTKTPFSKNFIGSNLVTRKKQQQQHFMKWAHIHTDALVKEA
jgi:hypothetical protein